MRATCQSCAHYAALNGHCRAHAPQVFLLGFNAENKAMWAGTWPPTQPNNWCAEHKPAEDVASG